jgi:mannose-6-phosphate isomerase-like protein (cupin superfamily)
VAIKEYLKSFKLKITEEDVFEWFKIRRRFPHEFHTQTPSIEVINSWDGDSQHRGLFDSEGYVDVSKVKYYYDKGHTLLISNVFDLSPQLRQLENVLEDITGFYPMKGNLYFGKSKGSFSSHSHVYDVFVKQLYGTCHWTTGGTEHTVLLPGDVLHIPKNVTHFVHDVDGPRLSLTINML